MGYAGNALPTFTIPTCIADGPEQGCIIVSRDNNEILDFCIGDKAMKCINTHQVTYPIHAGEIEDFDLMEKFWQQCTLYTFIVNG